MFEAILLGMVTGLISSFITGPVFFSMIKTSIEKGFKAGFSLAVGVVVADMILISIVLFGSQFIEYKEDFEKYIGVFGGFFLLAVGMYYFFSRIAVQYKNDTLQKVSKRGYLIKGFLMCMLTPSTLMFWFIVSGFVSIRLNNRLDEKILCFFIALSMQLFLDGGKTFYSSKLRYRIKESTLALLNKGAGIIIILFALWLIGNTYIKFYR